MAKVGIDLLSLHVEKSGEKNCYIVSGLRALRALQISLKVAGKAGTRVNMLCSKFRATWPSLSNVTGERIWLINIHIERVPATLITFPIMCINMHISTCYITGKH